MSASRIDEAHKDRHRASHDELVKAYLRLREAQVVAARAGDVHSFVELVMKDEATGRPVKQAPVHYAWHDLADQHDRLVLFAHVEAGKSQQMSVARVLHQLGMNPMLRVAIVSNTDRQATKLVGLIGQYIASSNEIHEIFPDLRPSTPWTNHSLMVQRPKGAKAKDPSVSAFGVHGAVLGARFDLIILDDILDYENCRTEANRDDLWNWYHATLAGRLVAGGRVICIGTAFHRDDALHRWAKSPGWTVRRFPVVGEDGSPRWPERWPAERIEKKRVELGDLEFARQLMCDARDDRTAIFKEEWVRTCLTQGVQLGRKHLMRYPASLDHVPPGYRILTGVDLAVQKHEHADWTVLFTIAVHPDGKREVLDIEVGRWHGPEIVSKIVQVHRRFQSIVYVESNSSQDFIRQFTLHSSPVPIRSFITGRNKANPAFGIESLATEMANGQWIIPNEGGRTHPEVGEWIREMLWYTPDQHTGDRLMASWIAREGARLGSVQAEVGRVNLQRR